MILASARGNQQIAEVFGDRIVEDRVPLAYMESVSDDAPQVCACGTSVHHAVCVCVLVCVCVCVCVCICVCVSVQVCVCVCCMGASCSCACKDFFFDGRCSCIIA